MCALWTKQNVHIGFLFQRINTGPWAYLMFHSIRIQFQATLLILKMENKNWTIPYLIYCTRTNQSASSVWQPGSSMNMDRQTLNRNHREFCWSVHLLILVKLLYLKFLKELSNSNGIFHVKQELCNKSLSVNENRISSHGISLVSLLNDFSLKKLFWVIKCCFQTSKADPNGESHAKNNSILLQITSLYTNGP